MSAYMVDREHICFLVSAARKLSHSRHGLSWYWEERDPPWTGFCSDNRDQASTLGQVLWDANLKSVNARYKPTNDVFIYSHARDYRFDEITPVQVFKAIQCLAYQSCEYEAWKESEAFAILEAMKYAQISCLPGYDDAQWGAPIHRGEKGRMLK